MLSRYILYLACLAIGSCLHAEDPAVESPLANAPKNMWAEQSQMAAQNSAISQSESDLDLQIPIAQNDMTITKSSQQEELTAEDIGQSHKFHAMSQDLSQALKEYENSQISTQADTARKQIRNVLISLILELIITSIVLQIVISLIGFPVLFYQSLLLAIAVAIPGALLEYNLSVGLLNPFRIGLGFILLALLIRPLSNIRELATAIRIALLSRLISIVIMWLAYAGVMVLFGL